MRALELIQPRFVIINVIHPREITREFEEACCWLTSIERSGRRPVLKSQYPVFRGVNDSAAVLEELQMRLLDLKSPVLPYYMVHPFYNGTLPKHRMDLAETQSIYRELMRRPGVLVPRLVVPTPDGKCVLGANEELIDGGHGCLLYTKDGRRTGRPS
jgi:L-lysine 2,3-aminomutase